MRSFFSIIVAGAVAAGCGGNVVVDGSGGAGTTTSTGTSTTTILTTTSTTSTTSSMTTSSTTTTSTTTTGCPASFPGIEASCDAPGQVCPVPDACCSSSAKCVGGFWKYESTSCPLACTPACGPDGFACAGGTVCVAHIGQTTTYQCAADPCAGSPLSCACAAGICAAEGMACNNIQMGFKVLCD